MKSKSLARLTIVVLLAVVAMPFLLGWQENQNGKDDNEKPFVLTSTTFADGQLPVSMAFNSPGCAPSTSANPSGIGGDMSPQISWTRAKHGTRSFVVILYDSTASFTHWGMYNISPEATGLPENAGMVGSKFGQQISSDFFLNDGYDGPCPPTNFIPTTHEYVLTVYALDVDELTLPTGTVDFPPAGDILYNKLIKLGIEGHVLESASIHGFFSAVTPNP